MNIKDLELNFARIQFYKLLASKLHPTGAFSLVQTAFLRNLNMYNYIVSGYVQYFLTYKFWVSKQHPAELFPSGKLHSWIFRECMIVKTKVFFPRRLQSSRYNSSLYALFRTSRRISILKSPKPTTCWQLLVVVFRQIFSWSSNI